MIKAGDKVVCVKDYEYVYTNRKANYTEGFTYEVLGIGEQTGRAYIKCDDEDYGRRAGSFFDIHGDSINSPLFSDYFIPLSEFREQQIKSVLDDNN